MVSVRDKDNVALYLCQLKVLAKVRTLHHHAALYEHPHLGRVLVLDKEIQHVEAWVALYHEPLVHLAAAFVEKPQTALVLGGGSFYAVHELLKYRTIKHVLMLDHDATLLDVISETYEHAARARRDPRLEVFTTDAFRALPNLADRFDLVINDSVDLLLTQGPRIFAAMADLLQPGGVCSDVVYRHIFDNRGLKRTIRHLRSTYRTVFSLVFAPEYPGILHLLTLWSPSITLSQARSTTLNREQQKWAEAPQANPCSYFDPRFLAYYLYLPRCVRDRLGQG